MVSVDDLPSAVATLVRELGNTDLDARQAAVGMVGRVLESLVRERLDDGVLAASLDGLSFRSIKVHDDGSLDIAGAFYTLSSHSGRTANLMLPMQTRLSSDRRDIWTVWVADANSQFEIPESERDFQRAFESATWRHRVELRTE